jgi:hypothetical protein
MEDLFAERLTWFKQNEKPEPVLVVNDTSDAIKIVIAWSNMQVKHNEELSGLTAGDSENEVWEWLWENTRFSLTDLKEKAGVPYSETVLEQKLMPLIGNRVLYPDGTVNSFVQRYLRGQVAKIFESKSKRTTKSVKS